MLLGVSLRSRWQDCPAELQSLAHGLHRELAPLLESEAPIPTQKAQLTRQGGRCAHDGTPLTMDPWSPHIHTCPRCAQKYEGTDHDAWWAMGAQLWTMERALHAAVLGRMWEQPPLLALSASLLDQFAAQYAKYPNRDNALGPTRPFFSTYLESVWLLNGCLASLALRGHDPAGNARDRFASCVIEPSRALIASYPEGRSNRQTWHTAAQLAAAVALGDMPAVEPMLAGPLGVHALLARGLLDDGSWYEGENYHLFAHRGLWYGVSLLESLGHALPDALGDRFARGFVTPWLGVLPDGTFPSRRDSRYAVSVHQWRFAEWCELGLARRDEPVLARWLERLYASELPAADTGRARSTADIERDEPPSALSRASLGWRTLLCARLTVPAAPVASPDQSVVLPVQGLTVLRADAGRLYVALEGGDTGGGHGHPDRLALTIQDGHDRVLEDPGAGSYVERALHWYRSTLAHNAPLVDGRSQARVPTELLAFDAVADDGWMRAQTIGSAPGVRLVRTVVLFDTHVVDHLTWEADREITLDLPLHVNASVRAVPATRSTAVSHEGALIWTHADPGGAGGLEDGFDFLTKTERVLVPDGMLLRLADRTHASVSAWYGATAPSSLWRAQAPGPPGTAPRRMHWWRAQAASGALIGVWSLRSDISSVTWHESHRPFPLQLTAAGDAVVLHEPVSSGWQVTARSDGAATRLLLGGLRGGLDDAASVKSAATALPHASPVHVISGQEPLRCTLAEAHYRRSEQSWLEAGAPTADVELSALPDALCVVVHAHTGVVTVPPAGSENPFDNERADVNADGVQCHIGGELGEGWSAAWLLVPDPATGAVRQTPLAPDSPGITAAWSATLTGWRLTFDIPRALLPVSPFRFDLLVNERPPDRARRRGQLILSGASGAFVYLRGDRHDPSSAWLLRIDPPDLPLAPHA